MSDEIVSSLGFDASNAIQTLQQLDGVFASFQSRMDSVANTMKQFNGVGSSTAKALAKLGSQSSSAAQTVASSSKQISTSMTAAANAGKNSAERLTVSWGLLARITTTQLVVRGLSQLRSEFESTAQEAITLQKTLARVTTIQSTNESVDQLTQKVKRISDLYNLPINSVARGLEQAISNQVPSEQAEGFLSTAAKLSKSTGATVAESVDLISGVLKSYNLEMSEAEKVSSVFFKTADLGRTTVGSLAEKFGSVGPLASDLGISLEEVGSAIASISIRGVSSSETLTALRGVMTALLKPSDTMRATLDSLGYSSSQVAIKTVGLTGLLRALSDSTNGSAEQMSKLFQNVRGLSGISSLTSDDLATLSANIEQMTAAGRDFNESRFLLATDTDAERVTASVNRLKSALVVGLGNALLDTADNFIKAAGGVDELAISLESGSKAMIGIGAGLTLLIGKLATAKAGAAGLSTALGALAVVPVAQGLGESIGDYVNKKRSEVNLAPLKASEAANQEALAAFDKVQNSIRDKDNKTTDDQLQNLLKLTRARNVEYLKQQKAAEAAAKVIKQLEAKSKLSAADSQKLQNARSTVNRFQNTDYLAGLPASAFSKLSGKSITVPDELSRAAIDAAKQAEKLRSQVGAAFRQIPEQNGIRNDLNTTLDKLSGKASVRNQFGGEFSDNLRKQFDDVDATLQKLRNDTDLTDQEIGNLIEKRNQLGQSKTQNPIVGELGFGSSLELIDQAIVKLQELQKLQSAPSIEPQQAALQQIEALFAPYSQIEASSQRIADNWTRAAEAAQKTAAVSGNTVVNPFYKPAAESFGGMIGHYADGGLVKYFADGGFASRGTDTIPAMLSPGEMVISAASTRKFYSQLQAINAGVAPSGGNGATHIDNSITVGDVHVHGKAAPVTAGDIAREIQRGLRRGTIPNRF